MIHEYVVLHKARLARSFKKVKGCRGERQEIENNCLCLTLSFIILKEKSEYILRLDKRYRDRIDNSSVQSHLRPSSLVMVLDKIICVTDITKLTWALYSQLLSTSTVPLRREGIENILCNYLLPLSAPSVRISIDQLEIKLLLP